MKRVFILVLILIMQFTTTFAYYDAEDTEVVTLEDYLEVVSNVQKEPTIQANCAILFDRTSKRILYEKNAQKKVPNASTTKILTAIVAYENSDINDIVTVSKKAAGTGGSSIKLKEGDKVSLNDLIVGLLLHSGNDAAVAIAEHIGGSVEEFCEMMNEKAVEIGAVNTHFTSPHGLDNELHYSTAYDLAIMADYALNIPYLANIVKNKTATIRVNNQERIVGTTNEMLSLYNGADGLKTGYTGKAGRCLVTSATRDDWQLISVVLGCNTKKQRTVESTKLLNYGFQNFSFVDICENMQKEFVLSVNKGKSSEYLALINITSNMPLTEEEVKKLNYSYEMLKSVEAPLPKGYHIGKIEIKIGDDILQNIEITLNEALERKTPFDYFLELLSKLPPTI